MPNTSPVADNAGTIALIREKAQESAGINIFTTVQSPKALPERNWLHMGR